MEGVISEDTSREVRVLLGSTQLLVEHRQQLNSPPASGSRHTVVCMQATIRSNKSDGPIIDGILEQIRGKNLVTKKYTDLEGAFRNS